MSAGWKGKDCLILDRNLTSNMNMRTFLVIFAVSLPLREELVDADSTIAGVSAKEDAFREEVGNLTANIAHFFDVSGDNVDILEESQTIDADNVQRRLLKSLRCKVIISDDFERFESQLTEISVALGSFLGSNVQLGAVELTCGLGYFRPSCKLDQPCRCAVCKVSTYKDLLEDIGYERGCTPCPSEYMETEEGATRFVLDLDSCSCP